MTSPLTWRSLDRLSVWIVWAHYAVDDYVIIWSNLDKNWRRRSILKGVMTSYGHVTSSVTSPFERPRHLSYRLPIVTFPLSPLVSEIFDLKVADTHTYIQAGRRQVRSLLTVCDIDVYVFSCICHTPLIILTFANVITTTELSITLNINHTAQLCAFAIYCYCTS